MADAEERERKREERRRRRKEKGELKETEIETNDQGNHLNGHPDVSRETVEGLEQKSDAALPDVVKVPSGLNEDWESPRPITPEIDDEGFARGNRCGLKSYSSAIAAQGQKSELKKRKEQYANRALSGSRYDSDEDAEFEPHVQSPRNEVSPSRRRADDIGQGDDEWSHLSSQRTTEKPLGNGQAKNKSRGNVNKSEFYTNEELNEIDGGSESSGAGDRSRKVSDEWKSTSKSSKARGVNKPKSYLKKSDSWIRERPELPEEPILKEPEWLDLVRKRRWRSTVKARFPQSERERILFERRLDTSKKGLKFNPRGEPTGITGPDMDDELSIYLLQQRRRIQSDDVFDPSLASSSRSAMSSERSFSESDYSDYSFDQDPRNRELSAEKGILNLSRPPIKGPKKEVHKNLAMERSRQSTMKWRFSIDPQEDPLWTQLPRPNDIQAINDMDDGNLEAKFWSSKKKFQSGQFNPPPVLPKPRSRSSSDLSRSHSASEIDFDRCSSYGGNLATEEMTPMASRSSVKDMKQKLASGEFQTSTPLPVKPVELEEGYIPRLRDVQQRLADEAESSGDKVPKSNYISPEELASMGDRKKSITEETFTEKTEIPKPVEKPRMTRRRSDAEFLDFLASRKEEVDASAVETAEEISSVASNISKAFGKDGDEEQQQQKERQKQQQQREKERKEQERKKEREEKQKREEQQRQKEREEKQRQKEREEKQREKELEKQRQQLEKATSKKQSRTTSPEFLVKLKDCEVLEGNDISFEIVVSGEPEPVVEWFLDEKLISRDKRHTLKDHGAVHSLTITDIQLDDEGIYECVAKNSVGKTTCDCELLVND